uniref:Exostosin GT47 domain-containing protein n=1 Tax=Haptolina brevifila TaxID=156173 RepID=A0A7S2JKI6_9EUKA
MTNMGRPEYSQGVRQAIQQIHRNQSDFVLGGRFTLDDLRASRFCLCPSGWGWGWRLSLAIVTQCVPVIIQPNVTQPFEDLLEGTPYSYDTFAVRLTKEDIPQLPAILRSIPQHKLCSMQQMLARVYRAFLWQRPHGPTHANAYDLTQILLCRRAKALAASYQRSGKHPMAYLSRHPLECPDTLDKAAIRFD